MFKHWNGFKMEVKLPCFLLNFFYHKKGLFLGPGLNLWKILVMQQSTCWIYLELNRNLFYFMVQIYPVTRQWNDANWLDPLIMIWFVGVVWEIRSLSPFYIWTMHFSIDEIWLRDFFGPFQVCFVSMCRLIPTRHIITHIGFHNLMSPDLQVSKKVSFKVSKIHL